MHVILSWGHGESPEAEWLKGKSKWVKVFMISRTNIRYKGTSLIFEHPRGVPILLFKCHASDRCKENDFNTTSGLILLDFLCLLHEPNILILNV